MQVRVTADPIGRTGLWVPLVIFHEHNASESNSRSNRTYRIVSTTCDSHKRGRWNCMWQIYLIDLFTLRLILPWILISWVPVTVTWLARRNERTVARQVYRPASDNLRGDNAWVLGVNSSFKLWDSFIVFGPLVGYKWAEIINHMNFVCQYVALSQNRSSTGNDLCSTNYRKRE
jgi:hypothetical protein